MGRNSIIPAAYADQYIKFRVPYTMPGEIIVDASQTGVFFPEAIFIHNVDKPFEIERMRVGLTALDENNAVLAVQPPTLRKRVRLNIEDVSKNESITKAAALVDTLVSGPDSDEGSTWEWYVPYTIERSEGLSIGIDTQALPAGTDKVRVEIVFQGSLIVIQPASETR